MFYQTFQCYLKRLELTAQFQPPACVAPSAGYPELSRTVLHVHRYYILNALSAQLRAFTQLFYSECSKAASPESGIQIADHWSVVGISFLSIPDTLSYYSVRNRFTLRSYPGTVSW